MAQKTVVYWRDIPAQVIVKKGREVAKRELPEKFIQAIDRCAMKSGADGTDAYLAEWRRGKPEEVSDDIETEVETAIASLEAAYSTDRLKSLVDSGGKENG